MNDSKCMSNVMFDDDWKNINLAKFCFFCLLSCQSVAVSVIGIIITTDCQSVCMCGPGQTFFVPHIVGRRLLSQNYPFSTNKYITKERQTGEN